VKVETLQKFLTTKPIYYKKFDPTRILKAYQFIHNNINHPLRVQLFGTNGKGSTGRAIAHLAYRANLNVGHFTSPHILDFKERFWINGELASKDKLEEAHKRLFNLLGRDLSSYLSYFEYQTLLAFILFENCDLQVIEAGLGGEFDATSVANYQLSVVVPIGFDHSDFLGNTLEEIATTKLKAIAKKTLIAKQNSSIVYNIAKKIAAKKDTKLYFYEELKENNYAKKIEKEIYKIATSKGYPKYICQNILNATFALNILDIDYNIQDINRLNLFGRFYKLAPNIIVDVGHNPLAATAIVEALKESIVLIFNILNDKDYKRVLNILKPKIEEIKIIKIQTQRATELKKLEDMLKSINIKYSYFNGTIDKKRNYLVFGSFYVVEEFLKSQGVETL